MNLGALLKMAKGGGMGPDELQAVLSAAGMDVSFTPVPVGRAAFEGLGCFCLPSLFEVTRLGKMKGGDCLDALLVVSPQSVSVVTSESK